MHRPVFCQYQRLHKRMRLRLFKRLQVIEDAVCDTTHIDDNAGAFA